VLCHIPSFFLHLNLLQTSQLVEIAKPTPPHAEPLYYAILSHLAKAILLQAETEVTAEKNSAVPLAKVAVNLLSTLDSFPEILFAKMAQRAGPWVIPTTVSLQDCNGDQKAWRTAMGYRKSQEGDEPEGTSDYSMRVSGIMRVYFEIMATKVTTPLNAKFETSRYWTWFARMCNEVGMLQNEVAASVIYSQFSYHSSFGTY
jgi:nucleoporin GLE1